ncbi:hypothetical protein AB0K00_33510 [Dactylosporangium sp. NPDC049525]|uniref:LppU/SCO3897 family protein n=1 Tax=Dactylosporangium sp. NPDC049525 TaxID=3154730 RepID=UPI00343BF2D1
MTVPPDGRRARRVLLALLAGLAVVLGGAWYFSRPDPVTVDAGDCLKSISSQSVKVVDCGSAEARYAVLGLVEDRSEVDAEAVQTVCRQWPEANADFWRDRWGDKGVVVCLKAK